jgi:hypothetical protein
MSRRVVLVAVVLPVLAIALGIVRAELLLRRAPDFVLEMDGYDPRDLLRGHYLQFTLRVDPLAEREPCDAAERGRCCVCLTRAGPGVLSAAARSSCATARAACDGALPLEMLARSYRFYVPEKRALELERQARDAVARGAAHAAFALDADGVVRVREVRIDGTAIPGSIAPWPTPPGTDGD